MKILLNLRNADGRLFVILAKAGTRAAVLRSKPLDPRFREGDGNA
jgi:hypothetical protein